MKTLRVLVFLISVASMSLAQSNANWPQWRGPNRDGISKETGLLKQWPAEGPALVWKASGAGGGYSSFSVANGKLLTMGLRGEREFVVAFDVANGKRSMGNAAWHRVSQRPRRWTTRNSRPSTATVYALGGSGDLSALELRTGRVIWTKNILKEFGGRNITWGISESPLIVGNKLLVNPAWTRGVDRRAQQKRDGSVIWKSQSDRAGYSSAIPVEVNGGTTRSSSSRTNGRWLWI